MKTCTRCKRSLSLDCFVISSRYTCGRHPHCKECRKALRVIRLANNPLCARCKLEPHRPNHDWCLKCQRLSIGRSPVRYRRKALEPHLCPVCNIRPKVEHRSCRQCANSERKKWIKSKGGQWAYCTRLGNRHKLVARAYVNHQVHAGKLQRLPCEVCGKLESEAHHNSYENPLDIRWLCMGHHDALERWIRMKSKKNNLTGGAGRV